LGIEFLPGVSLEGCSDGAAALTDGRRLNGALAVWTAGVHAGAHIRAMEAPKERQDRLCVDETLRVGGRCYAAGDCAGAKRGGQLLRLSVQFSISQGHHAAGNILREIDGRRPVAFRPVDLGYVVPMANFRGCGRILGMRSFGRLPSVMHYLMSAARSWGLDNRAGVAASVLAFR
jgi:NADH dehydrogenase FAD-containing subunit